MAGQFYQLSSTGQWRSPGRTPIGQRAFVHPGVMYSNAQLSLMASEVANTSSNRYAKYGNLMSRTASSGANSGKAYSDTTWTANPWPVVGRGASGSPSQGDSDLQQDVTAALVHALNWRLTGSRTSGSKACEILNAWSATITEILYDTTTWSDGKLLAGWTGTRIARAAEIMRHTGWTAGGSEVSLDVTALENMLTDVWVPRLIVGHSGGGANWLASFADSLVQIGVFCEDSTVYNAGIQFWRDNIKSIFWMPGDKNKWSQLSTYTPPASGLPISAPNTIYDRSTTTAASLLTYWRNPTAWPAGLETEIGRDFHHAAMGYSATFNAAETAYLQGTDLYTEQQERLVTSCELFTKYIYDTIVSGNATPPGWPFAAAPTFYATSHQRATWELCYMHYHGRKGIAMPNTLALLTDYCRPNSYDIDLHVVGEELTYRDNEG